MREPRRLRSLDQRRRWARARAPVWVLGGAVIAAATAAAGALIVLAGLARGWSWITGRSITDAPVWDWVGEIVLALGASITVLLAVTLVLTGVLGAPRAILRGVGAVPIGREGEVAADGTGGATDIATPARRLANVVAELSIGLGVTPPALALVVDPAPNALSVRRWSRGTVVATTGLLALPRAEVEAVLAHELAQLHLSDARWITAAEASVGRARAVTGAVAGIGTIVLCLALYVGAGWSLIAVGGLLAVTGAIGRASAGGAVGRIRRECDEVADVAAVRLARNPASLAAVCDRLARDDQRVGRAPPRADGAWFKLVPGPDDPAERAGDELRRRAAAAYREAGILPPPVASSTPP